MSLTPPTHNTQLFNFAQDSVNRAPCTMGSPHYHAFSAELQNNVGTNDGSAADDLYVFAVSDDMKHSYFGASRG